MMLYIPVQVYKHLIILREREREYLQQNEVFPVSITQVLLTNTSF